MERKFPNAAILTHIAGGVPCAKTCSRIVANNVVLVGDAAHQVNPVSGGGIISGMIGGMIGGQVAAEAIAKRDLSICPSMKSVGTSVWDGGTRCSITSKKLLPASPTIRLTAFAIAHYNFQKISERLAAFSAQRCGISLL